ncbi:MAG TPA: hypothetical protein VFJ51_07325 [Nitrososphaeraceae archaeon]|nr:hypothetical protein [Nitrososphaeraceae archaeon]
MNKPIIMATATMVILAASALALLSIQMAKAQYGGATGGNIEEQLKLAKAKITNAHAAGAYGSGVPMLGTNLSETEIFIIVLVAVFGGVAAAFFIKSRSGAKAKATA